MEGHHGVTTSRLDNLDNTGLGSKDALAYTSWYRDNNDGDLQYPGFKAIVAPERHLLSKGTRSLTAVLPGPNRIALILSLC